MKEHSGMFPRLKTLIRVVHVKIQAEHVRLVLLNICKLSLSKNNVTYIKKKKMKSKNISLQANKKTLRKCVVNKITLKEMLKADF